MADLALEWRDDLQVSPSGDLALTDGSDLTRQAIIRRLLTAVFGYIWHLEYGAGLPQRIGRVARQAQIQSIVRAQILLEKTVARIPAPTVTVKHGTDDLNMYIINVVYTDAGTGSSVAIEFDTAA